MGKREERTVAAWNVHYLVAFAEQRGLARDDLVRRFALDEEQLADVDGRLPLSTYTRMWDELPVLLDDEHMPLHVSRTAVGTDLPLNALIYLSAPTVRHGLERLLRYQRLTFDLADEPASEMIDTGDRVDLVFHHERTAIETPTGPAIDGFIGVLLMIGIATQRSVVPLAVRLRHPHPRDSAPYVEAFGCLPRFEAHADCLTLRREDVELPHVTPSPNLSVILARHADDLLSRLPTDETTQRVHRLVRDRMTEGALDLSTIARDLGMSSRTLQRRLADAGVSLRSVIDEERRALAIRLIRDPKMSLVDIAYLLGFSDQTAFSRAFARWTHAPPTRYRRDLVILRR